MVHMKGLEPPRLSAPDPKSGAAANYATCALIMALNLLFCSIVATAVFASSQKMPHMLLLIFGPR